MSLTKEQFLSITYLISSFALIVTIIMKWSNLPILTENLLVLNLDFLSIMTFMFMICFFFINRIIALWFSMVYAFLFLCYSLYVIFVMYGGFYLSNLDFISGTSFFYYLYPTPYFFVGILIANLVASILFLKDKTE